MSWTAPPAPADPELAVLMACTRSRPDPAALARIAEQLHDGLDTQRLLGLAEQHGLLALLYQGLARFEVAAPVRETLHTRVDRQAVLYEFVYPGQLARILQALADEDIPILILKGHALGATVYQQPMLRPYGDFDLLVPPEKLDAASAALARLGYRTDTTHDYPPDYHLTHHHLPPLVHPEWLPVELHWRLIEPSGALALDMLSVWEQAQPLMVGGVPARTLAPAHLLNYLALHAVNGHLFDIGLKALCDVNELIAAPGFAWEPALAVSQAWRCTRQLYLLLAIVRRFYGDSVPVSVLDTLCPDGIEALLLAYCCDNVLVSAVAGLPDSSGLAAAWQQPNPARRWQAVLARLFPAPAEVARAYHLAPDDWRRWLFYPRWQAAFIRRHLPNGLRLLRADPAALARAQQEINRRDLLRWIAAD